MASQRSRTIARWRWTLESAQIAVVVGGVLSLLMGVFHLRFYALFGWHAEFESIGARSRRILFTIHLGLLLMFFALGTVTLAYSGALAGATGLAFGLDLTLAAFWGWRAVWQVAYFRPPRGPKGAAMRRMHIMLTVVFALLAAAYAIPLLG